MFNVTVAAGDMIYVHEHRRPYAETTQIKKKPWSSHRSGGYIFFIHYEN